jgi:glycine/D-amino acid oxidase-like deaminating enzyme
MLCHPEGTVVRIHGTLRAGDNSVPARRPHGRHFALCPLVNNPAAPLEVTSAHPIWPELDGVLESYPSLRTEIETEVLIIGAGITGAMVADAFVRGGHRVVVLDKDTVAHGSTSASTAILLYEIDTDLHQLIELRGEADAVRAYQLCRDAIYNIRDLVAGIEKETGDNCGFEWKKSWYLASSDEDVDSMRREYESRCLHGFETHWLSRQEIESQSSFSRPAALLVPEGAHVDAYRLAGRLLQRAHKNGAQIYERTHVIDYHADADGVTLETRVKGEPGPRVRAARVIFATGYQAAFQSCRKLVNLKSTYVAVSEPVTDFTGWPERVLMWETARPYLYLRTTPDNRILIGGEDDNFSNAVARDRRLSLKVETLQKRFAEMFPHIAFKLHSSYAGTFGETFDGLAFIGEDDQYPRGIYTLGFGGNGITFSAVAARLALDMHRGIPNPDARLFRFDSMRAG